MGKKEKTTEDTWEFVRRVSAYNGWKLNPDKEFLADLVEGLRDNYNRYGYFLCPCRDGTGERAKDKDIICPCDYNVPDQADYGHCYCALYFRSDYFEAGGKMKQIPERRPEELQFQ
jgi:ferredoxin-thioredoxin reductase catalytic subunit